MKKTVVGIIFAVVLLGVAASYFLVIAPSQAPIKPEKTSLILGVSFPTGRGLNFVPIVGIQKGIFQKYGFSVEHVRFTGASELAKAKAAGQVDVSIEAGLGYFESYVRGVKYKIVGAVEELNNFAVIAPANQPITSFQDLRGKKLCVTDLAGTTYALATYVASKTGVKPELVGCGPTQRQVAAMESGSVQAAVGTTEAYRPYPSYRAILMMKDVLPSPWQEYFVMASPEMIEKYPNSLKLFLRAAAETTRWIKENPKEATEILAADFKTNVNVETANAQELQNYWVTDLKVNPQAVKNGLDILVSTGLLKGEVPPVEEFYNNKFQP